MKRLMYLASSLGLLMLCASVALAHGGQYTGPGGGGSSGGFAPAGGGTPGPGPGPAGGGTGGGGTSPGGGGTTGPGAAPGGSGPIGAPGGAPAGAPGTGPAAAPGAGTTGGGSKKGASDANLSWSAWWFFNDDKYLNLKAKIRADENETDNADIFAGDYDSTVETTRVNAKTIREKINPVLKLALKDKYYDTRAAALIALGKTGEDDALAEFETLTNDTDKRVRESSFLAMGILGNKAAIPTLIEVMNDTKKARKMVGRPNGVLTRTRSFAALAIGLIGSRHADLSDTQAVSALVDMIKSKEKTHRDLKICPIVALGLMRSKEAVPFLVKFFQDRKNQSWERAYAATSLGKIGDPTAVKPLLKGLSDKQNAVIQSSAIALGIIAKPGNADVTKALQKQVKSGADLGAKNFSIIALGEIGGLDNRNYLARLIKKGNSFKRTFSALGLAVYMSKNHGDPEKDEICKNLLKYFNAEKNPDIRGANAIAMGIMKYAEAGPSILAALKKGGQASLRSNLCISMGLMGYEEGIKEVRNTVRDKGDIDLRRNAAIALGLLGDRDALKVLEDEISDSSKSKAVHGAVTQGLGFIGDVSAVPTLVKFVRDSKKFQDVTRAFAAVALGLLGDKDNIPVIAKISENNNYLTRTDAIGEVLTIL